MANMDLWNSVSVTNPAATKRVNQRGGFTAIDAYSQIEKATEVFGPVGVGWGWSVGEPIMPNNDTVAFKVTLWHGNKEQTVEQFGQSALTAGSRADNDAFKKAVTDGLTKCLSYLGFNADVFLGKFDDSKYVQQARNLHRASEPTPEAKQTQKALEQKPTGRSVNDFINGIKANTSLDDCKTYLADMANADDFKALSDDDKEKLRVISRLTLNSFKNPIAA